MGKGWKFRFWRRPAAPSSRMVTVMFVDIVGFSISAERMQAEEVFRRLRALVSELAAIVRAHGGIIDKTIGDGFLAFFGCGYDGRVTSESHADAAIRCACELQRFAADRALRSQDPAEPVYPLRVGLNTAPVFLGDLGAGAKEGFTLIGHGVNIAQRLEYACESFRIMVSEETLRGWIHPAGGTLRIHKRQVQMKHRESMFEAFEIDPFESDPDKLTEAMRIYRERTGLKRKEGRMGFEEAPVVAIHPERMEGTLVNFSANGLALETATYFSKGTRLSLSLDLAPKRLAALCRKHGVPAVLTAEVRWGTPSGDRYLHGAELSRMSPEARRALNAALVEYVEYSRINAASGGD